MSNLNCFTDNSIDDFRQLAMRFSVHGYQLYLVGGSVRDLCLKKVIHDFDMTTDALPQTVYQLLSEWGYAPHKQGIEYGTVGFSLGQTLCEITTMRLEGAYEDGRHPKTVEFTKELANDLQRRDFTINAMALSPDGALIDPFNGYEDLDNRLLKTVGDPQKRLSEDGLRVLRAIRMKSMFDLEYDPDLKRALINEKKQLLCLPMERVRQEFEKSFKQEGGLIAIMELFEGEFFQVLHPEVQYELSSAKPSELQSESPSEALFGCKEWLSWFHKIQMHGGWKAISEENRIELGWILVGSIMPSEVDRVSVYQKYGCSRKRISVWCDLHEKLQTLNRINTEAWVHFSQFSERNQPEIRKQWLNRLSGVSLKDRMLWIDLIGISAASQIEEADVLWVKKRLKNLVRQYPLDWQTIRIDPNEMERLKREALDEKSLGQALNTLKMDKRQELWNKDMEKEIRETYNGRGTSGK